MRSPPIISVTEWSRLELPPALNTTAVKHRLVRAGTTKIGDAFRLSRGDLFARGLVGLVSTPDAQVQILPKTTGSDAPARGLRLLTDMLRLEFGLGSHLALAASGERHSGVLEVIIGGFARSLSAELNIGIPRRYFPAVEDLQTIRGRIDLDHQARVPPGAALTVRVRHAPLQIDNHLTRALKAVALTLLDQTRSAINRALLLDCLDALQSVKQCALTEALLHRAETNRFERRWQWAVDLGRVFLHGNTPDPVSGGPSAGFSILFALHGLFERALRARLRRGLQGDLALRPTKSIGALLRRSSTGRTYLNLEPDVLIDRKCSLALIGDAKWKRSPQGESLRDDAYQMATYLLRASAGVGFLAYPSTDPISGVCSAERYSVEASDLQLFVLNIDAERLCSSKAAEVALTCDALRNAVAAMIP